MDDTICIVCCETFDETRHLRALVACCHDTVCSICFLRIRALNKDMSCPTCKAELEHVICVPTAGMEGDKEQGELGPPGLAQAQGEMVTKTYSDFNIWGDTCGPEYDLEPRSKMFFPSQYYRGIIEKLWTYRCNAKKCNHVTRDLKSLKSHYSTNHNLLMCQLCIDFKQVFPAEQKVYTQKDYETHLRKGDGDGSEGHPSCDFCKKRYYDKTALFTHLSQDHFTCHLCEKKGIYYRYYNKYLDLEDHFRKEHFLCEEPECLANRFVVFGNVDSYNRHTRNIHLKEPTRTAIPLSFSFTHGDEAMVKEANNKQKQKENERGKKGKGKRGGDKDGEKEEDRFDAGLSGQAEDGEWQVEVKINTRDPRRREDETPVNPSDFVSTYDVSKEPSEEYPSLSSDTAGGLYGWSSSRVQRSGANKFADGEDEFPTLTNSAPPAQKRGGNKGLKHNSLSLEEQNDNEFREGMVIGNLGVLHVDKKKKKKESFVNAVSPNESVAVRLYKGEINAEEAKIIKQQEKEKAMLANKVPPKKPAVITKPPSTSNSTSTKSKVLSLGSRKATNTLSAKGKANNIYATLNRIGVKNSGPVRNNSIINSLGKKKLGVPTSTARLHQSSSNEQLDRDMALAMSLSLEDGQKKAPALQGLSMADMLGVAGDTRDSAGGDYYDESSAAEWDEWQDVGDFAVDADDVPPQTSYQSNALPSAHSGGMKMSEVLGGGSNDNNRIPPAPPSGKALGGKQKQLNQQQEKQAVTETKEPFAEKGLLFRGEDDPDGWKTIAQRAIDEEEAKKTEKPSKKKEKGESKVNRQPKKTRKMLQGLAFGK